MLTLPNLSETMTRASRRAAQTNKHTVVVEGDDGNQRRFFPADSGFINSPEFVQHDCQTVAHISPSGEVMWEQRPERFAAPKN